MKIYLVPKGSHTAGADDEVRFGDLAKVFAHGADLGELEGKVLRGASGKNSVYSVPLSELVAEAAGFCEDADIEIVGEGTDILVLCEDTAKRNSLFRRAVNVLIYLSLFFGSALSVMYFHMDVSMIETLEEFVSAFGADSEGSFAILTVAYSVGLGLGMFLFFKNRFIAGHRVPSPIDTKLDTYHASVMDFMKKKLEDEKKQ